MWNITSNNVQRAKERLQLRRAETEARYAEEKEALDAEFAVIETLERAASEFMLKLNRENGAVPVEPTAPTDPPGGYEQDSNAAIVAEAPQPAAPIDMPGGSEIGGSGEGFTAQPAAESDQAGGSEISGSGEGFAAQPAAESDQAGGSEIGGGLDILKPGSRWRLYRGGSRGTDPEGAASDASPSTG
jgi:hypothetical protein